MTRTRVAAVALASALAFPAGAAEPPCAAQCAKLAREGKLQEGISAQTCAQRVCHEAARSFYRENDFDDALQALDYIRAERSADPSYELDRGLVLYGLGRYEEAIESFDVVIRVFPNSVRGGAQRGHALVRLGRLDQARKQFESLLDNPGVDHEFRNLNTRSYLLSSIGLIKLRQGDLPGGKKNMEEALRIDASNRLADTFVRRVIPSLESGELAPEGLGLLENAFEHMTLGRLDVAAREFEQVIERWPRYVPAYLLLAEGLRAEQRYDGCEDLLRAAEKHHPEDTELRLHRIRCSLLRHGVASVAARPAVEELRQIAEKQPDNRLARQLLAAVDSPF